MEYLANVNGVAVIFATMATFLAGWAWHSDLMFGSRWRRLMNVRPNPNDMMPSMIQGILNTLMANLALAVILQMVAPDSATNVWLLGILIWVAVSLYENLGAIIWAKRSRERILITSGHTLLVILISISVLSYMG